jgi:phosphohistidine phosphatase
MIYLMRHADAVSDEENPLRPLSARGRDQVDRVCRNLKKGPGFAPVEIWHSPLARSRETAELLVEGLGLSSVLLLKPGLMPDDDPGPIAAALAAEARDIAVVGHEPHLGVLASLIVNGPHPRGIFFPFSKAGLLVLSRSGERWESGWIVRSP